MTRVLDLAAYILQKQGRMTPMKLQKLVYYAQVWSIVADDPLFPDTIKAWKQGPVVPALFQAHKGRANIEASMLDGDPNQVAPWQRERVDRVLAFYGGMTAEYLSELSHHEKPWQDAIKDGERRKHASPPITSAAIRAFYRNQTPEGLEREYKMTIARELMKKHRATLARLAL